MLVGSSKKKKKKERGKMMIIPNPGIEPGASRLVFGFLGRGCPIESEIC
jgi:hypothetical protein